MATIVKFLINDSVDLFAYFPQLNFNKRIYGTTQKVIYAHVGQHSSCHIDYAKESKLATKEEYTNLLEELKQQGYTDLKVLNK